jgi:hypothetical protein
MRLHLHAADGRQVFRRFRVSNNVGQERAGVSQPLPRWQQVESGVGRDFIDTGVAQLATAVGPEAEKFKTECLTAKICRCDFDLPSLV